MPMDTTVKYFNNRMTGIPQVLGSKGSFIAVLDALLVNGFGLKTLDSLSITDNVATAVCAAGHGFQKWQVIKLADAGNAALNIEHRITEVVNTTTFKFETAGVPNGVVSGTISALVAPLGWKKVFTATNVGVYQIDTTKYPEAPATFLRFDERTWTYCARVTGFDTMLDVDTGDGEIPHVGLLSSGLGQFVREDTNDANQYPYWIIGNGQTFYVGVKHSNRTNPAGNPPAVSGYGRFKSKLPGDKYNFMVAANYPEDNRPSPDQNLCVTSAGDGYPYGFMHRGLDLLGGCRRMYMRGCLGASGASGGDNNSLMYPNPVDNSVILTRLDIFESFMNRNAHRGALPGAYHIPQQASRRIVQDAVSHYIDAAITGMNGLPVIFLPQACSWGAWSPVAFDLVKPWEY